MSLGERLIPSYDAQVDSLFAVQAAHREYIQSSGMIQKIMPLVVRYREQSIYHLSLSRASAYFVDGTVMHRVNARLGERWVDHNGNPHISPQAIAIAETYKGVIYPCGEFEVEEAQWAVDQTDWLEKLGSSDYMPDLDDALSHIRDSTTGRVPLSY